MRKSNRRVSSGRRGKVIAAILIALAAVCVLALLYMKRISYVNGAEVTDTLGSGEQAVAEKYLKQNYAETHTFRDAKLNQQFVKTSVTSLRKTSSSLLGASHYDATVKNTVDETGLRSYLDQWNSTHDASTDAAITYDDASGSYKITKETYGKVIDTDNLLKDAEAGKTGLKLSDYYVQPVYTSKSLKASEKKLNEILAWKISYTDGQTASVTKDDITVNPDGTYTVADKSYKTLLTNINNDYRTVGKGFPVMLHDGTYQTVTGGTWGMYVDQDKELNYIREAFKNLKSEEKRTPIMAGKENDFSKYDSDLIIEVSIAAQHVWAYDKSGNLKLDYDCVTGQKGKHDTPTGIYFCSAKNSDYTMTGANADGSNYTSKCQRFIRLTNSGVGIHDASWRSKFGGSIYLTNGSHGCINSPVDKTLELADMVTVGKTMIIVH